MPVLIPPFYSQVERTDFKTWKRETLEAFARQAADENLVLRHDLKTALAAWRSLLKEKEPQS